MNIEKGIKRILWVISLLGILLSLLGIIFGIYSCSQRTRINEMQNDPRFKELSIEQQNLLLQKANAEENKRNPPAYFWVPFLGGITWFGLTWGLFFIIRWIVYGFKSAE